MGPIACPEMSVNNYQHKMCNIPEERKPEEEKPYQLEFGDLYGTFLCIACYYPVTNDTPRIVIVFLIETLAIKRQHTREESLRSALRL